MKKFDFVNRIVKQGNSLCVRVPNNIVKQGNLREGMEANVIISPPEDMYAYTEKSADTLLKIANKVKKLNRFDELKKRFFIMLNFAFLKETIDVDMEEAKSKQMKFIDKKKKEFGEKIIDEFIDFATILNGEAYVTEGDVTILKSKYRYYLD
jgi:antitoxin component of MazEF toxin-antitoxin module